MHEFMQIKLKYPPCVHLYRPNVEFSFFKQKEIFRASLISTRLVKWPEANIGHWFLATKAIYVYRKKEGRDAVRKSTAISWKSVCIYNNI